MSTIPLQISAARRGKSGEIISISLPSAVFSIRDALWAINTTPYPSWVICLNDVSNSFLQAVYPPPQLISDIFCTPFCEQIYCSHKSHAIDTVSIIIVWNLFCTSGLANCLITNLYSDHFVISWAITPPIALSFTPSLSRYLHLFKSRNRLYLYLFEIFRT